MNLINDFVQNLKNFDFTNAVTVISPYFSIHRTENKESVQKDFYFVGKVEKDCFFLEVRLSGEISEITLDLIRSYLKEFIEYRQLQLKFKKESLFWFESFKNCPQPMEFICDGQSYKNTNATESEQSEMVEWEMIKVSNGELRVGQDYGRIFGLKNEIFEQEKYVEMALLSSSIAHELNNPLSVMKNYLYFLEKDGTFGDEDIASIKNEIYKIQDLTGMLLRKVKGREVSVYEWINFRLILDHFKDVFQKKNFNYIINISNRIRSNVWIYSDRQLLEELMAGVFNLCFEEISHYKLDPIVEIIPASGDREVFFDFGIITPISWKDCYNDERSFENLLKFWSFRSQLSWPHVDELGEKLMCHIVLKNVDEKLMIQVGLLKENIH